MSTSRSEPGEAFGLYLLFPSGRRPDRAAIEGFVAKFRGTSISLDPQSGETAVGLVSPTNNHGEPEQASGLDPSEETHWVELLRSGLTFDLQGLAPGKPVAFPEFEHSFDLEAKPSPFRFEALKLAPGQHLAGAEASLPVITALTAIARDMALFFDDFAGVVWSPSKSAIGGRFYESIASAWLEGGAFPALGYTAFRETFDGALQSVGLEFFVGQELRIEPPLSSDKVAATRLGVRLINQLVAVGGLEDSERIIAPDGSRLVLRPSRNGKFIRVWRE